MKPSDALELVALAMERWPAPKLAPEQMRRYAEDLADLDGDEARAALDALHGEGREFRPGAGDVRRMVARLQLAAPEWAEVKRQLIARHVERQRATSGPAWECPASRCDGSGWVEVDEGGEARAAARCECYDARREARRCEDMLDPLVREFFDGGYATWAEVDVLCSEINTTLEAQMRGKWEAFTHRAIESRVLAAIESAPDLPRLAEARQADAPRREIEARDNRRGLRRPRFLAALAAARDEG